MKEFKEVNEFEITGQIGKARRKDGITYFPVFINNQDGENIHVSYSGVLDPDLLPGDVVHITGHIVGRFVFNRETNERSYIQRFVAEKIGRARSDLSRRFGIEGGRYATPGTQVRIAGTVVSFTLRSFVRRIGIRVERDGRQYTIMTNMFIPRGGSRFLDIARGDKVYAIGTLSQKTKDFNGTSTRFENIVLSDILAVDKSGRTDAPGGLVIEQTSKSTGAKGNPAEKEEKESAAVHHDPEGRERQEGKRRGFVGSSERKRSSEEAVIGEKTPDETTNIEVADFGDENLEETF